MGSAVGFGLALAAMGVLAFGVDPGGGGGGGFVMLFVAGVAGASAMILPGLSGAYLLLVLGQYVVILGSVSRAKDAAGVGDVGGLLAEWTVVVPVGVGVVVGVAGLSNLIKWLLHHRERATLGVLLGLLVGSVLGLWPFQETVAPAVGDEVKGVEIVEVREVGGVVEAVGADGEVVPREDWGTAYFAPSGGEVAGAAGLVGLGLGLTMAIAAFGGRVKEPGEDGGGPA